MRRNVWFVIVLLCLLGIVAQAAVTVTTRDGDGEDAVLTNDNQGQTGDPPTYPNGPDTNHGTGAALGGFRQLVNSRSRTAYVRFDLTDIMGSFENTILTMDADYLKGGAKTVTVFGLNDGRGDYWEEAQVTYNTAAGLVPNPPTALGNADIDEAEAVQLGTLAWPGVPDPAVYPVLITSDPATIDLASFLAKDTNGLVTLIFIGGDNEGSVTAKENTNVAFLPPRLTLPDVNDLVARAHTPVPAAYTSVSSGITQLSWTNPEPNNVGESITCDVYFGTSEPNVLLPNLGLPLLQAGISGNTVTLPALSQYTTYYWKVDIHDSSFPDRTVPGVVWVFDTNNTPPVANAGTDQYVWLTKAVVDTGSDADTTMQDATVAGAATFMDVRGASVDRAGYLRFDLSELSAMGPGVLSNATLTLRKIAGSRNDTITTGRFSLHGLNNVAGNTPQNWDEATLSETGTPVGAEWNGVVPMDLLSGRITNLDGDVAGITETIAADVVTITGAALEAFLQSRVDDNGLVTFIIACEDGSDRGYGIASKENSVVADRPRLQLTYVPTSATNNGDAQVTLSGSVQDDGLPNPPGASTVAWTQVSGPSTITISPADVLETSVSIGTAGTYVFRLTADDSDLTGSDDVQVYVGTTPCDAAQNTPNYTANIADFNSDCLVNMEDLSTFAAQWLECNSLECP